MTQKRTLKYEKNGESIDKLIKTPTGQNDPARVTKWKPYRQLKLYTDNNQIANGGTDSQTVTISVVNGLEVARGADRENASVLDYSGDVTVTVDGVETTKTLSNGIVSFDLTTDKPAGSTITVTAESLADHPAESDSATIEVVSA